MSYVDFLKNKVRLAPVSGFEISDDEVNPILKSHQAAIVKWAVRGGKRAIFAAFGLGKSVIQIEVLRIVSKKAKGRGLIVLPLGVRQEFRRDGRMLGVEIKFIRSIAEAGETGLYMTNYETVRDGKIDPNDFIAVTLDEASVLRSYGSKTYQTFLTLFDGVRYRFVATATPSPNRYKELIHYAGFLGIMDTGQALTRFFQRDSTQANNLTLYPHKEKEFWLWLNSWAIFLQRPSDLGYSDEGYSLPPFKVIYHEVQSDIADGGIDRDGQSALFKDTAIGVVSASKEKRDTLEARIAAMQSILAAAPADHFIIWHDLEDERRAIEKAVPGSISIYGTQDLDKREQSIVDFSDGKFQHLAAKPVIAGSGCNFQRHCHKAIFLGIGFKFNDFIQALHRIYRFLQTEQVEIHIIYAESEREVLRTLQGKWEAHNRMVENMSEIIRAHGLDKLSAADVLTRSIGVERIEAKGDGWLVANNDCVAEAQSMADNSVDMIVTSIPFSNHYEYTPSYNDFGHTDSDAHFFEQMDFLTPELLRILKPGRIYACHTKDRIMFGNVTGMGMPTVNPFHAKTMFHTMSHGFAYMGMITINTDVVRENNQTYRLGWTENCKDGTKMGVGSPEYVLLFRKLPSDTSKAYADDRVAKDKEDYTRARWQVDAHAFWRSSGDRLLTPDELASMGPDLLAKAFTEWTLKNVYDYETHIRIGEALELRGALPSSFMSLAPGAHDDFTWHDVNRMRTLNGDQTKKGLENHICPLQFDIVDRLIKRYSNEGDLVFDPFGGLFTVPYRALKLKRRGRASELNPGYFLDGIKYLEAMEREVSTPTMFDIFETKHLEAAE
ncbi:DNA methyltransferase [Phyllobacterium chamaecytisi]|uniref:DNA methyltransferase n=1 Tax=Phyllobacterium chamaecytisi TaxID=2876082 RepID=UPI001CCEC358|nr:DNA methyltransferase [Phyllobacterium sp. KW56]MBZ9600722.1 DNA methylase N-4 [Phyllobacterium sp. KW56]